MWWLLLPVAIVIAAALAIGAALNSGPKPQHARPRHLAAVPDPPEVGSMILAEERRVEDRWPHQSEPFDWLPGPYLQPDWREQTMAELSPEALNLSPEGGPWHPPDGFPMGQVVTIPDPGPGGGSDVVSSPPSGPDQAPPPRFTDPPTGGAGDWLEAQMADLYAWVRSMHAMEVPA